MLIQFGWSVVSRPLWPGNFGLTPWHEEILVGFDCSFVSEEPVFGYAKAVEPAPKTLKPPSSAAFSNAATFADRGPAMISGPRPGTEKNAAPNSKPTIRSQCAGLSPILHSISRVARVQHLFIGEIVFADDR